MAVLLGGSNTVLPRPGVLTDCVNLVCNGETHMIFIPVDAGKIAVKDEGRSRTVASLFAIVLSRGDRRCLIGYEAEVVGVVAKHGFHFLFFRFAIVRNGDMYSWL